MTQCILCRHPGKHTIEKKLLQTGQVTRVAKELQLCYGTVWNHFRNHLPYRSERKRKKFEAMSVMEKLADLSYELQRLTVLGECGESVSQAVTALRERRRLLEVEARLNGMLERRHDKLFGNQQAEGEFEVVFVDGRVQTKKKETAET